MSNLKATLTAIALTLTGCAAQPYQPYQPQVQATYPSYEDRNIACVETTAKYKLFLAISLDAAKRCEKREKAGCELLVEAGEYQSGSGLPEQYISCLQTKNLGAGGLPEVIEIGEMAKEMTARLERMIAKRGGK